MRDRDWVFDNGRITSYRPVKEQPLSQLTDVQRGYIRAIFRAFPGDMERILLELSALRYCSLKTALRSAVRDGCLTEEEAEEHYLYFNQEVAKLPTRSKEYITALASGYNAGIKYDVIAAYVGKAKKRVLTDLCALRTGVYTRHLFKGSEHYNKPKDSACVRVKGPVPEWEDLIKTPFIKEESADSPPPPSQPAVVTPSFSEEASKAPLTEGAGDVSQLEELINGGAAFLSALPHEDFPTETSSGGAKKTAEGVSPSITITAGSLTVTISAGADITIHITQGGDNNV